MNLNDDEQVLKVYHHHLTTFIFRALGMAFVSLPFYFMAALLSTILSPVNLAMTVLGITVIFGLVMFYDLTLYYFDRLIITNRRVVYIDWKSAVKRDEHEAEIMDIQDISTEEAGVFAFLPIFDFGMFKLETASTKTSIIFTDAPDPEGIKHFIYHLHVKPSRIGGGHFTPIDDTARQIVDEEAAISRRQ